MFKRENLLMFVVYDPPSAIFLLLFLLNFKLKFVLRFFCLLSLVSTLFYMSFGWLAGSLFKLLVQSEIHFLYKNASSDLKQFYILGNTATKVFTIKYYVDC